MIIGIDLGTTFSAVVRELSVYSVYILAGIFLHTAPTSMIIVAAR